MNGTYDGFFVATSVLVAMLASFTALDLARSITPSTGLARRLWLAGGSIALGFGIWSMHFIGMLAFSVPGVVMSYAVTPLAISILVAIAASGIALWITSRSRPSARSYAYGAIAMGAAICGMHYIGMAGVEMSATIEWRVALIVASALIAIAASLAALWLSFRLRSSDSGIITRHRLLAAAVMGVAIAGMHYTGMAAAVFVPTGHSVVIPTHNLLATDGLAVAVTGSTLLILAVGLLGSLIERELSRRSVVAREIAGLYAGAQAEIEERSRVERALRERDERLSLALDAGGMGTWELHDRGRIVMSGSCRDMHGLPADFDGSRQRLFESVHPDDREKLRDALKGLLEHGTLESTDYRVVHADSSIRWVTARGRRFDDPDGAHRTIGICTDVTSAREMETRLRQSQKLEAIGHLAGGVAHDFNNILTAIRGHVDLLRDSLAPNDPRRNDAEEIARAAQRAADLTSQLLAFAGRQMLRPRTLDLSELVLDVMPMLRRLIGENIELVTAFDRGRTFVRADPSQIEQIVLNLAVNARDAMPRGGRVSIEVRRRLETEPVPVVAGRMRPGDYVVLRIADQGSGIPDALRDRIFEPFYTTKPIGKGTGLGLATVLGIVNQAGGYLALESELDVGTTFSVWLPATQPDEASVAAPADAHDPQRARRRRSGPGASVLVVEDEPSLRSVLQRALRREGYDVMLAASGEDALTRLEGSARCDLVLTDLVMPGMSGLELSEHVRRLRPGIPVIYMSGYSEEALRSSGFGGEALDFLPKPFSPDTLCERLAAALDRQEAATES